MWTGPVPPFFSSRSAGPVLIYMVGVTNSLAHVVYHTCSVFLNICSILYIILLINGIKIFDVAGIVISIETTPTVDAHVKLDFWNAKATLGRYYSRIQMSESSMASEPRSVSAHFRSCLTSNGFLKKSRSRGQSENLRHEPVLLRRLVNVRKQLPSFIPFRRFGNNRTADCNLNY
jgi:hypothetical protein